MPLTKEAALRAFAEKRRATTVMQHRHFAVISQLIATLDAPERFTVAVHFANGLAKHNPNFDRVRFLRACEGVKSKRPAFAWRVSEPACVIEPDVNEWMKDFGPTKGDTK